MEETLLRIFAEYARMEASKITIEGMKTANEERLLNGEALAYTESDMEAEADGIRRMADDLDNYRLGL